MNKDWLELLDAAFKYFQESIFPKIKGIVVYPKQDLIFKAFKECPLKELKVVILGQD